MLKCGVRRFHKKVLSTFVPSSHLSHVIILSKPSTKICLIHHLTVLSLALIFAIVTTDHINTKKPYKNQKVHVRAQSALKPQCNNIIRVVKPENISQKEQGLTKYF